eukprot:6475316-Amphidinium_carterae.2
MKDGAKAKAMPAKCRSNAVGQDLSTANTTAPHQAVVPSEVVTLRTAEEVQSVGCARDVAMTQETLAEQTVDRGDPQNLVTEKAKLLLKAGILKFQKPLFANLGVYMKNCVAPMCNVLHIRPYFMSRRGGDDAIRVAYKPIRDWVTPICTRLDVESFRDFRLALVQIGGQLVTLWYIAFEFTEM